MPALLDIHITRHARRRAAQRGVSLRQIRLVAAYGRPVFEDDRVLIEVDCQVLASVEPVVKKQLASCVGIVVVMAGPSVVTVFRSGDTRRAA